MPVATGMSWTNNYFGLFAVSFTFTIWEGTWAERQLDREEEAWAVLEMIAGAKASTVSKTHD